MVDATAYPAISDSYLAPAFPLAIAAAALALFSALETLRAIVKSAAARAR
jgi:hypothetical protein